MKWLKPKEIVAELDKYVIGQHDAKRAVAIAVRNRWRRQQLGPEMKDEVLPKNIIMIGPTGVGKTEIARRLAGLVGAPFLKVEASKYTEVGYVGRDVESMVRDLVEISVGMVRKREMEKVEEKAKALAEERLVEALLPGVQVEVVGEENKTAQRKRTKERLKERLARGAFEERMVEIEVEGKSPQVQMMGGMEFEHMGVDFQALFEKILPSKRDRRKMTVREARDVLAAQEAEKLIDRERVSTEALEIAQNSGILFVDEIDKIVSSGRGHGPDVSREGVQRDLLPIVEGSTVVTRYGMVRTDHILFVAAGAFHGVKPSDLIPELQGRFPIRVELQDLGEEEFVRILTEPQNALTKQYTALLATDGVELSFEKSGIREIARMATQINQRALSIGARRLHTVVEKLLEDVSYEAPDVDGRKVIVNAEYVREKLSSIVSDEDLTKYIL